MVTVARSALLTVLLLVLFVGLGQAQGPENEQGLTLDPRAAGLGPSHPPSPTRGSSSTMANPSTRLAISSSACGVARGTELGATEAWPNHQVTNGLFQVLLNASSQFGGDAFRGQQRYLQVAVRCPTGSGTYTTLDRQLLAAVPYALAFRPGAIVENKASAGEWTPGLWLESTNGHALAGLAYNANFAAVQGDHRGGGTGVNGVTTSTAIGGTAGVRRTTPAPARASKRPAPGGGRHVSTRTAPSPSRRCWFTRRPAIMHGSAST